jgi:hypothetical protein
MQGRVRDTRLAMRGIDTQPRPAAGRVVLPCRGPSEDGGVSGEIHSRLSQAICFPLGVRYECVMSTSGCA